MVQRSTKDFGEKEEKGLVKGGIKDRRVME